MFQFQGIENVKKSKVTKDTDCLEILSEAVKWKECDENWKNRLLFSEHANNSKVLMTIWFHTYDTYDFINVFAFWQRKSESGYIIA